MKQAQTISFLFPFEGDCLNRNDGVVDGTTLTIRAQVAAEKGQHLRINGIDATESDGIYTAPVCVPDSPFTIRVENLTDGSAESVTVYRLPENAMGGYRISSDDNILFLQDLTLEPERYPSAFDHPYLAIYREAHEKYGAKVHLNLFYEFSAEAQQHFSKQRPYFNLSMMTDRYREEFTANAHWLRFSFHSKQEFPPCPYKDATAEEVTRDCRQVQNEIVRFAGPACLADETTVHFGAANREVVDALRALGYRALAGYFEKTSHGNPLVAYYASSEQIDHFGQRDFWFDRERDMLFARIDLVLNLFSPEQNAKILKEVAEHPHRGGFVSVMIHEQYFYPDYNRHLPDFASRVLDAAKYLWENGYRGTRLTELL